MGIAPRFPLALALAALTLAACSDQNPAGTSSQGIVPNAYTAPVEPINGEFIRQSGTDPVYLVYNRTLYGIPDMQTLRACTGGYEKVVRAVSSIPAWPVRALPSAGNPQTRPHGRAWMHGDKPIQSTLGGAVYLLVGCVRAGIPSEAVYQQTFGDTDWSRVMKVADADLKAFPEGPLAQGHPLRRAGTLLESAGGVRWVAFHGGSLGVPDPQTMDAYCRPWSDLITASGEWAFHAEQWVLQSTNASCLRGNDYPYANRSYGTYTSADVDPWNFYFRECTSFVAWRLNQDGVEFHNTYRQPSGYRWSHAYLWNDAAARGGVVMNNTPRKGAVAQFEPGAGGASSYGHVAYVAAVHNDGYITIEEYNYSPGNYGTRRIPAAWVSNYIHFR